MSGFSSDLSDLYSNILMRWLGASFNLSFIRYYLSLVVHTQVIDLGIFVLSLFFYCLSTQYLILL